MVEDIVRGERAAQREDTVADEVRRVLGEHDALAQHPLGKGLHGCDYGGVGVGGGNDFEQPEIARRVKEVRAEEMLLEFSRAACGDLRDGNAGGVAAHDGVRFALALNLGHQGLFRLEVFEDGLDDPIGCGEQGQVVCGVARRDALGKLGQGKISRAGLGRAFKPRAHQPVAHRRMLQR